MKKTITLEIILCLLLVFSTAVAEEKKPEAKAQLTTADAKKKCKEDGKEGKDLIDCIKEKKGDK